MPRYTYVAIGPDGLAVHGTRKASTSGEVELALYDQHMHNIRVTDSKNPLSLEVTPRRVKRDEIMRHEADRRRDTAIERSMSACWPTVVSRSAGVTRMAIRPSSLGWR